MKLVPLVLCLAFSACVKTTPEDSGRFKGERGKTSSKARKTTTTTKLDYLPPKIPDSHTPLAESLIFPIKANPKHTSFLMDSNDHKKITFSAEPSDQALNLVAMLSGNVSLTTENGKHKLSLSDSKNPESKTFHFELSEKNTTFIISDGASVRQTDKLASTTSPIIFYVRNQGKLDIICLNNIQNAQMKIIKNFPDHPECQ